MNNVSRWIINLAFLIGFSPVFGVANVWAADQNQPPPGGPPQLTEDQKTCLQQQGLPEPGTGTRPSHEQVEAAFQACNIQMPTMPPHGGQRGAPRGARQGS